jgi:hypothetical protein
MSSILSNKPIGFSYFLLVFQLQEVNSRFLFRIRDLESGNGRYRDPLYYQPVQIKFICCLELKSPGFEKTSRAQGWMMAPLKDSAFFNSCRDKEQL